MFIRKKNLPWRGKETLLRPTSGRDSDHQYRNISSTKYRYTAIPDLLLDVKIKLLLFSFSYKKVI